VSSVENRRLTVEENRCKSLTPVVEVDADEIVGEEVGLVLVFVDV